MSAESDAGMDAIGLPMPQFSDSLGVRQYLVDVLNLDLVGPGPSHHLVDEQLPGWIRPSNWYLTGFLVPSDMPYEHRSDDDEDDDLDETPRVAGLAEESTEEGTAKKKGFFPSSIGLSFLAPADAHTLEVTVRWGDYALTRGRDSNGQVVTHFVQPEAVWQRQGQQRSVAVPLSGSSEYPVPQSSGLRLHVVIRSVDVQRLTNLPEGTKSVSVFLVNNRSFPTGDSDRAGTESTYAFQTQLTVRSSHPFVPRPDPRGANASGWDDLVADLHYSDTPAYATGHGVSADWEITDGNCHVLRTTWLPDATVKKTQPVEVPDVELSMEALGTLADGAPVQIALQPLVDRYRNWVFTQGDGIVHRGRRRETAEELLRRADFTADRMQRGIKVLSDDPDALDAFRVANRCVARALRQRLDVSSPKWRAFQLAFILLNLSGLADPQNPERRIVDLLFFPTGGGKTEAYLGLAAFAIVLRRLRRPGDNGCQGGGVAVIMRYTLRLLTLDQLTRASGLVCALELERQANPERYGDWPFEIGLWVGKAATPNMMGRKGDRRSDSARMKTRQFKANPRGKPSPIPIESCPWCNTRFEPMSFTLLPNDDHPRELRIICANFECEFSGNRSLPVLGVDEQIYRRLPSFLIATVDKFASLPWTAESGALLGGADRYDESGFYGAADSGRGRPLSRSLSGPELVIQDELHLISGPLGTMAGLYETVINALCLQSNRRATSVPNNAPTPGLHPKIVASTATVRQAQDQIQALFGRSQTQVFPPPGPDRRDSFFAEVKPASEIPGRLYLGITSPGRSSKLLMRRVWLALMGAAEKAYYQAGGRHTLDNQADPYMTVLGYFNSLRELGGARRILEEEVQNTLREYSARRRVGEKHADSLFRDRKAFSEVVELTSRVPTAKVAEARQRLGSRMHESRRVDSAIATNMISVGLDISRLGLMVVLGQPKTHAEYIQATSRVGRDDQRPGLVVTLLNAYKPRDRSHYERFRHYHETFYRSVEVSSVTPFSARALDRGMAGAVVALSRHIEPKLTASGSAERLGDVRTEIEKVLIEVFQQRVQDQAFDTEEELQERLHSVRSRVADLLDSWLAVVDGYRSVNAAVKYQRFEPPNTASPLLREMLDTEFESSHHRKFRTNRSLRDVEPSVQLHIRPLSGDTSQ